MSAVSFAAVMEPKLLARRHITEAGCWLWTGALSTHGYGVTNFQRKQVRAHQAAYRVWVGDVPEGMQLDHTCRNRSCFNPAHLECVTGRENTLRGEGPSAINAAKTHCAHGHEFTPENTRLDRKGKRVCKKCHCENQKRHRAKATGGSHG